MSKGIISDDVCVWCNISQRFVVQKLHTHFFSIRAVIFHFNLSLLAEILCAVDAFISNYHLNPFKQEQLF